MKRLFFLVGLALLVVIACNKSGVNENALNNNNDDAVEIAPVQRTCAANDVLEEQIKQDPSLRQRMDEIEAFTKKFAEDQQANRLLSNGTMEIPVVVNVLFKTNAENISDQQIQSQIDVLNEDYSGNNSDVSGTPSVFQPVLAGDTKIHFTLQAIVRKQTNKKSWTTNDAMKKSQQGGINPTSPTTTLNMWSCNMNGGILGYAQFPGGNPATDGVVILYSAFGSRAKYPGGTYINKYDLGRTASHEIGHYFNLRHIWGDATCGNDFVNDTPIHTSSNFGCPTYPDNSTCGGNSHPMMTMNYMDYTDDACMFMFTGGQKTRMQATYAVGGPRASLR